MSKNVFAAILAAGCAGTVAAVAVNPAEVKTALAVTGAALASASCMYETQRSKQEKKAEAIKVAQSFKYMYEKYRGVISPQELSFLAEVSLDKTLKFLDGLIEVQNGVKVGTEAGLLYSFPHPQNALDQLTANAQDWARAQTQQLINENSELRNILSSAQQAAAANSMRTTPFVPTPATPNGTKTPVGTTDPWNNLL